MSTGLINHSLRYSDLPCDFRINARVISCSRDRFWLFSGERLQHFAVVPWLDADIFYGNEHIYELYVYIFITFKLTLINQQLVIFISLYIKSNQTLFSNLYKYKHVIHDEIYILEKSMEKKLNNL